MGLVFCLSAGFFGLSFLYSRLLIESGAIFIFFQTDKTVARLVRFGNYDVLKKSHYFLLYRIIVIIFAEFC
jgi:hypothetical protein